MSYVNDSEVCFRSLLPPLFFGSKEVYYLFSSLAYLMLFGEDTRENRPLCWSNCWVPVSSWFIHVLTDEVQVVCYLPCKRFLFFATEVSFFNGLEYQIVLEEKPVLLVGNLVCSEHFCRSCSFFLGLSRTFWRLQFPPSHRRVFLWSQNMFTVNLKKKSSNLTKILLSLAERRTTFFPLTRQGQGYRTDS